MITYASIRKSINKYKIIRDEKENPMHAIDINCDMGESYGAYTIGADEQLFPYITSANIACGLHAGDPGVMRQSVQSALKYGVKIGAHPGLPDIQGFGRRKMDISATEAYDLITYQIGALAAFVQQEGGVLHHVKPHGALYNMAAQSQSLADAIAQAIYRFDPKLILYGLAGSALIDAGKHIGLTVVNEVFADRTYGDDGQLTPRSDPLALITDTEQAVRQVIHMIQQHSVISTNGNSIPLIADSVCIHGDGQHAVDFVKELKSRLEAEHIRIQPVMQIKS